MDPVEGELPHEADRKTLAPEELEAFRKRLMGILEGYGIRLEGEGLVHSRSPKEVMRLLARHANPAPKPGLEGYFARPQEVDPEGIRPVMRPVETTLEREIFRHALSFWSVPVSSGYGRRLRYLVWDEANGKVVGILGLSDPVIGLGVRDRFLGWDKKARKERLWHGMTAYVLGAVPPYNQLLGGKLVASLALSHQVVADFQERYGGRRSQIRGVVRPPVLAFLDTMGAFGKSAIYNRLRGWRFVGYTEGQTHHHLSANGAFEVLRELLERAGRTEVLRRHKFGHGPNWKFRVISQGLRLLGLSPEAFSLGFRRGYYFAPLVENWQGFLARGEAPGRVLAWEADEAVAYWRERWLLPRLRGKEAEGVWPNA